MDEEKKSLFKKNLPILLILFFAGIIFLFAGEYDWNKKKETGDKSFDEAAYTEDLERRLEEMLERMEGVGEAKVMVTLEGSLRYQFAQEDRGATASGSSVSTFLLQEGDSGQKEPILIQVNAPKIKGVSVVCDGADKIQTRERILNLISGTLNLTKNKIYVTQ